MTLHYRMLGEQAGPNTLSIIILHGVFGTSDNWQSFGKAISDHYRVYLIDQRNHGQSPHSEEFNYQVMADDLKEFVEEQQLDRPVIIGHSMGGKAAMFFAVRYPELLSKLIVVDIAPRSYPVHHQAVLAALGAVAIDKIESRQEAEAQMEPYVAEAGIRQFLLKNLKRTDTGFGWKLNLPVIRDNIEAIGVAVPKDTSFTKPTLFIRGEQSDYVQEGDEELIERIFPAARIVTISGAGHWVHAEQPQALLDSINAFLSE